MASPETGMGMAAAKLHAHSLGVGVGLAVGPGVPVGVGVAVGGGVAEGVAVGVGLPGVAVGAGVGVGPNGDEIAKYFESLGMPFVNTVINAGPAGKLTGLEVRVVSDQPCTGSVRGNRICPLSTLCS